MIRRCVYGLSVQDNALRYKDTPTVSGLWPGAPMERCLPVAVKTKQFAYGRLILDAVSEYTRAILKVYAPSRLVQIAAHLPVEGMTRLSVSGTYVLAIASRRCK